MRIERTPLKQRQLPGYTRREELMNMWTHAAGGVVGLAVLVKCVLVSMEHGSAWSLAGGLVYGLSMIALYTVSATYHGMKPCYAKKVMQVVDHCTIYLLIAGTYTPILLCAIRQVNPALAWAVLGCEWGTAAIGAVFTAIDLKRYGIFSMCCYLIMGWLIVLAIVPTVRAITVPGFIWLLAGGIAYTAGAVLYGIGKRKPWMHTVFHVFVDLGSILQAVCIIAYVL